MVVQYTFRQANNLDWFFIPVELSDLFDYYRDNSKDNQLHERFQEYEVSHPEDFVFDMTENETGEYPPLEN